MAENQRVKKRGRRWIVVAVFALTVALLVGALVFREQPPYEFMRGLQRVRTEVIHAPPAADAAFLTYVSDLSAPEVARMAETEMGNKGWDGRFTHFTSQDFEESVDIFIFGHSSEPMEDERLREKTGIMVRRPPTAMDRFNAWLDDRLGR